MVTRNGGCAKFKKQVVDQMENECAREVTMKYESAGR